MPHMRSDQSGSVVDEADHARAQEYQLLAILLAKAPDVDLLAGLAALRSDASPLGLAHAALREAAEAADCQQVAREFFDLFVGLGRGELLPYGSYYLAGSLNDRPLALLREDLARIGIVRAVGYAEPEDHAAVLCEIMAGLVDRRFDTPKGADRDMFEKHFAPWIGRFFADLERAQAANFYRSVAAFGRQFVAIENEAFRLAE